MKKYRLIFIGFGVVGQGLTEILLEKKDWLKRNYGFEYEIVAAATRSRGSIANESGLDGRKLLALIQNNNKLEEYPEGVKGLSAIEIINNIPGDILIEITVTNIQTGEPALSHCNSALNKGMDVVTANKGPIALHYHELKAQAHSRNLSLGIEGTVMGGTPVINTGMHSLAGCKISKIRGVLNSTTSLILSEMETGKNYQQALRKAQQLGYAEADPSADVEGWDAVAKVVILGNVLMRLQLTPADVIRTGITGLSMEDIERAKKENCRWKLVGEISNQNGLVKASVQPVKLPMTDALARIDGRVNAISFDTDLLGLVTVTGSGGGGRSTGFALLTDMLAIHRAKHHHY